MNSISFIDCIEKYAQNVEMTWLNILVMYSFHISGKIPIRLYQHGK